MATPVFNQILSSSDSSYLFFRDTSMSKSLPDIVDEMDGMFVASSLSSPIRMNNQTSPIRKGILKEKSRTKISFMDNFGKL